MSEVKCEECDSLRSKIQNESEPCKCSSCTDRVPELNKEISSLRSRIQKLERVVEAAKKFENKYGEMTCDETMALNKALKVLEEGEK